MNYHLSVNLVNGVHPESDSNEPDPLFHPTSAIVLQSTTERPDAITDEDSDENEWQLGNCGYCMPMKTNSDQTQRVFYISKPRNQNSISWNWKGGYPTSNHL